MRTASTATTAEVKPTNEWGTGKMFSIIMAIIVVIEKKTRSRDEDHVCMCAVPAF